MRRASISVAAGIALLVLSVALALLGRAALAIPAATDRAAPGLPQDVRVGLLRRSLPDRIAADILASDRNDAFAEIVAIYEKAIAFQPTAGDPRGPVEIDRLIPELRSPGERSEALTIAGTLLAFSAGAGFGAILPAEAQASSQVVLAQARTDFRSAVRSDPGNEAAKYDLELLLRQQRVQSPPEQQPAKRKKPQTSQAQGRDTKRSNGQEHHAGIYQTGSGY